MSPAKQHIRYRLTAGFTLVELLMVIAISAIVVSIVLISVSTARKRARDNQRIDDVNQVRVALEQYYGAYKKYPPLPSYCDLTIAGDLKPYLTVLPRDPQDTGTCGVAATHYEYYVEGTGAPSLAPQEWLLRIPVFEFSSGGASPFKEDVDGVIQPATAGTTWYGGGQSGTPECTGAGCTDRDCGVATADTIYCLRS
jgi:prepilin-type N-terminal cleavage/methylation domain-containing protein